MNRVQRNVQRLQAAGWPQEEIDKYLATEGVKPREPTKPEGFESAPEPTFRADFLTGISDSTIGYGPKLLAGIQTLPKLADGLEAYSSAYGEQAATNIDAIKSFRNEHPIASLGSAIAGGFLPAGLAGKIAQHAGTISRLPSLANTARYSAAEGGLQAYNESVPETEIEDTLLGFGLGGTGGALGYGLGQALQRVGSGGFDKITGRNADKFALRKIEQKLGDGGTDYARSMLRAYQGRPVTLADTNEQTRGLGRAATSLNTPGRDVGVNAMNERAGGRFARVTDDLKQTLMQGIPDPDRGGTALESKLLANARRARSSPEYKRVVDDFMQNQGLTITPEIGDILKTPAARSGLSKAINTAKNERTMPLSIDFDEAGNLVGDLKFRDLDLIQRGMKQAIEANRDAVTGALVEPSGTAGTLSSIGKARDDLLGIMNRINPEYAAIRRNYADGSENLALLKRGRQIFREDFGDAGLDFDTMSLDGKEAFKRGVYQALRNDLSRKTDPTSKPTWNNLKREVLKRVMPNDEYHLFKEMIEREQNLTATENVILGGSPTARITEEIADFALDPQTLGALAINDVAGTAKNVLLSNVTKMLKARASIGTEARAEAIAKRLFSGDPAKIRKTLDEIDGLLARDTAQRIPSSVLGIGLGNALSGAAL